MSKTNSVHFNVDEQSVIKMYDEKDRNQFLIKVKEGLPVADEDMLPVLQSIIGKVESMTDEEFLKIDLSCALEFDVDEEI